VESKVMPEKGYGERIFEPKRLVKLSPSLQVADRLSPFKQKGRRLSKVSWKNVFHSWVSFSSKNCLAPYSFIMLRSFVLETPNIRGCHSRENFLRFS
jgi:hypothetical protein